MILRRYPFPGFRKRVGCLTNKASTSTGCEMEMCRIFDTAETGLIKEGVV